MVRLKLLASLAALAWLGLSVNHAAAEMIHWTYEAWTSQSTFATPSGANDFLAPRGINVYGNGSIFVDHIGPANISLAGIGTYNVRRAEDGPASFWFQNAAPFTLTVSLIDRTSQKSGQLSFGAAFNPMTRVNGVFTGFADEGTGLSTLSISFIGPTTRSMILGSNRYTASLLPSNPLLHWNPDPHIESFVGHIDAHVDVSAASPLGTPEPSCLVLASMGIVTVAGAVWRKRRCPPASLAEHSTV